MTRRRLSFINIDKFWVYSGLFGISLLLHYFTPYYQQQSPPDFVRSVIIAPLYEEFIYRFLGILIAFYSITKIAKSEPFYKKINWGMVFIISVYAEIGMSFLRIENLLVNMTLVFSFLYLGILLILKEYRLEIIVLTSSFNWAFIHESIRVFPVFIAGIFFSILCINRSRIYFLENQNRRVILFLLFYGAFICYLIHFWNNFLSWALYQIVNPLLIDLLSFASVIFSLFLLETSVNEFIDKKCMIDLYTR